MFRIDKPIIAAVRLEESATEVLRQAVAMARHYQVKLYVCHVLPDLLSVRERVKAIGIEEILTAPRSPWQNPFAERMIGTLRRDCLDHVVVLGEFHLRIFLKRYLTYYHQARTHLALEKDAPEPRPVQAPQHGQVKEIPEVGGLHHRYERRAA